MSGHSTLILLHTRINIQTNICLFEQNCVTNEYCTISNIVTCIGNRYIVLSIGLFVPGKQLTVVIHFKDMNSI